MDNGPRRLSRNCSPACALPIQAVEQVVQGFLVGLVVIAGADVVLQILADRGRGMNHRYPVLLQQRRVTDARQLQQLRRVHGAGGNDDLAARIRMATLDTLDKGNARSPLLGCQTRSCRPGNDARQ